MEGRADNSVSGTVHGTVVQGNQVHITQVTHTVPVPCQLPPELPDFTGRASDLAALDALPADRGTVLITAIHGMGGVGKTALAVHWAHRVRDRFPDGQLHVNLRGYDPGQPARPDEVLDGFLRALGVPAEQIPAGLDARTAQFRALCQGRRLLVLLDNANNAEQVRPLLPGSPGCLVLVTSRDSLHGLATTEGAGRLAVDLLPEAEALALVRGIIGERRAEAEPAAVAEIVRLCAGLPLALRIVAHRVGGPLAVVAEELADERERLDALSAGSDERSAVRAVFSWSYRALSAEQAAAFDLLGLVPAPEVSVHAMAALANTSVARARRTLTALAEAHLVDQVAPDRYGCHDLLRSYARELAAERDHDAAPHRLLGFALHTASAADHLLFPAANAWSSDGAPPPAHPLPLADHAAALAWFTAERPLLIALVRQVTGMDRAVWQLTAAMWSYFKRQMVFDAVWVEVFELGLAAARRCGDRLGQAHLHNCLADAYRMARRAEDAAAAANRALALCRDLGDRNGEAAALNNLGTSSRDAGEHEQALEHYRRALRLRERTKDRYRQAITLNNLGSTCITLRRYDLALEYLTEALALRERLDDPNGLSVSLNNLGNLHRYERRYEQAIDYYRRVLALRVELGDTFGLALTTNCLGMTYASMGRPQEAIDQFEHALRLRREAGDRDGEAFTLSKIGYALEVLGRSGEAVAHWRAALAVFEETGNARRAEEMRGLLARGGPDRAAP
ncbi:XRE family transcriptional regulator [Kutzneria viridogrisea]|uniref:Tetratricopeptide (TPR) repeat protein n=1 Tax=Kutzneria viridogrisea TaxID=47990 RepID=A0ABR6BN76_9PSEU|nr:tetratricopeptide (TPR) repeat protein [Kutzneria viridogrisea]